jgi:4'-phosphopantetheinyl transferase
MGTSLQPNQVHLRWLAVEEAEGHDLEARGLQLLSPEERARYRRFRYDRDRRLYLAAHVLLRSTLSEIGDQPPAAWSFAANRHGKPHLVPGNGSPPLRFNLTHTAGLAACAVASEWELGVDAESLDRRTDPGLANRFFSPVEQAQLEGLDGPARQQAFFDIWTLKESYVKGRGIGVSLPLRSFGFTLPEEDREAIGFSPPLGDLAGRWSFFRLRPGPRHTVAVAVNHPPSAEPLLLSSRVDSLADLL